MMLLYEADSKGISATEVLAAQISQADELATLLVEGVEQNRTQLDEAIAAHAKGWTLARMPTIDLSHRGSGGRSNTSSTIITRPPEPTRTPPAAARHGERRADNPAHQHPVLYLPVHELMSASILATSAGLSD